MTPAVPKSFYSVSCETVAGIMTVVRKLQRSDCLGHKLAGDRIFKMFHGDSIFK